jgi:hypothetical protein
MNGAVHRIARGADNGAALGQVADHRGVFNDLNAQHRGILRKRHQELHAAERARRRLRRPPFPH